YKDAGSPFNEFTPDERQYFSKLLADIYEQFVTAVHKCRDLDKERVKELADGRVFTGKTAKEYKLVDKIGTFRDAVDYVEKEAGVDDAELKYPPEQELGFLSQVVKGFSDTVSQELKKESTPMPRSPGPLDGHLDVCHVRQRLWELKSVGIFGC
ncbi:MAG: S49 family peptidase, partial [Bradymonadaceae bacterium]